MDWKIHRKDTTVSTNIDARPGLHGDVFVADFQTAGRGRLDHRWIAPAGVNLTFSAVMDVSGRPPDEIATMPLVVGLSVAQALMPLLDGSRAALSVKWPNDVLVDGHKLAGILCESRQDNVIAGIGVNVNQTVFPPELADRATSLALVTHRKVERDDVLKRILHVLSRQYLRWGKEGFAALLPELSGLDHLRGRVVSVLQTDEDPRPVAGLCRGIQPDGTLLVADTRIYAGEAHVL